MFQNKLRKYINVRNIYMCVCVSVIYIIKLTSIWVFFGLFCMCEYILVSSSNNKSELSENKKNIWNIKYNKKNHKKNSEWQKHCSDTRCQIIGISCIPVIGTDMETNTTKSKSLRVCWKKILRQIFQWKIQSFAVRMKNCAETTINVKWTKKKVIDIVSVRSCSLAYISQLVAKLISFQCVSMSRNCRNEYE